MIKKLFFLLALCSLPVFSQLPDEKYFSSDTLILFVPFNDASGFTGKWNIQTDIPRFLSVYVRERFQVGVISPNAVKDFARQQAIADAKISEYQNLKRYADYFRVRYIITAAITDCSVQRFIMGDQLTAGYESFTGELKFSFTVYDAAKFGNKKNQAVIYEGDAEGIAKDRGLGITLFGKQTDRTNQYYTLDELSFGSETFNKTVIGEAVMKCTEDFASKLERIVPSLVSKVVLLPGRVQLDSVSADTSIHLKRRLVNGEIVVVDGDEVFINLGTEDGIRIGDVLPVFESGKEIRDTKTQKILGTKDEQIGEIQIIELRAAHLAMAIIIKGKEAVKQRQRVRKILIR